MAVDKLINQTQGDEIIDALSDISEKLEDVTTMTPAKLGFGYTVCDTAASTAAKTANLANYQLTEGSVVFVKFTNGSTATNPTLNLNNTGAKPMYYRGAAVEPDVIVAGDIGIFVYSTNIYNLVSTDAGGLDAVLSVGAEGGIITDRTGGADIERTGKVKLNLKSDTAFTAAAPNPTEVSGRVYPVALDSAGHPAVGVPWTDTTYTQAADSAITVDNTNHTIGVAAGTTSAAGVVQLTDSYASTSTTTAATPNAVKAAYDLADSKYAKPNTGISKDDLEDAVKTSLGKADTALQTFTETDPTVPSWAKASSKPSYTASEVGAIATTAKGAASGVAELDANGKVPAAQLPSYVDDVLEYSAKSSFPATGETGKIYVDTSDNKTYRWSGSAYVEISASLALGETSSTAYYGDKGKTAYTHSQVTSGNPHNVTKSDVGLENVGNFKAVSTVASQGLSNTEKANARANIGAGTGNGTYSKPSGGIPKTDLASDVQTSLGLADGALQHTTVSGSPDLDTYLTTGVYHITTSTATHAPTTNHATLFVDATVGTPYQIFKPDNVDTTWYTRHRSGSAWTAWVAMKFTDTTYSAATTSAAGLMSATDKSKLDGIASGAQVNSITGVKGNSESSYRTGNVNLTAANIGAAASSHTHNYAGSSSAGGAATSANKLNTDKGSATQPVYFSGGVPVATTYSLAKSVPSDAKFTDTTYSVATTSANGLMSSSDKTVVNSLSKQTFTSVTVTGANTCTGGYIRFGKLCLLQLCFRKNSSAGSISIAGLPAPSSEAYVMGSIYDMIDDYSVAGAFKLITNTASSSILVADKSYAINLIYMAQ